MRQHRALVAAAALTAALAPGAGVPAATAAALGGSTCSGPSAVATGAPDYYAIELVTTGRVPGTRRATGTADVTFARSPFGLALTPTGEYEYDLDVSVQGVPIEPDGAYAVWVTTPELDQVELLGVLGPELTITGRSGWNKFLVVISLEKDASRLADRWQGTIVLRGSSRSGRMHTMAGHGPFQAEPCVKYGY